MTELVFEVPQWITLVGNFGFPIAITIYLFLRFEKKIEKLEDVIIQLNDTIKNLRREG
ncbi:MAG: YvrJ family protein [Lysinibacillus sp.]